MSSFETSKDFSAAPAPSLFHARRDLIAKRNAEADPIRRAQIGVLIEQLSNYDRATGMQRMALASAIKAHLNRMHAYPVATHGY